MPEIASAAAPYWSAWQELIGQRHVGMAAGPLRREAVTDWLDENGVDDPGERAEFRHYLDKLDGAYVAHLNREKPSGKAKGTS